MRTYLEKTHHKKGWWVAQGVGPEFKLQYCKKKKTQMPLVTREVMQQCGGL
jgi:hypothetical protein